MGVKIGTAGWSIAKAEAPSFPEEGSSLERYAARFPVAEINSSFHRAHRPSTWQRWQESVPDDFRFSAKLPKQITHQRKLVDCSDDLSVFLEQAEHLKHKLAVLLVQLPPKLAFEAQVADRFFKDLAARTSVGIACEPRHPSWFLPEADALLQDLGISRVAADPAICEAATRPGGGGGFDYWRLHGSPVIYRSSYQDRLPCYAGQLGGGAAERDTWCIFDNTASSAAISDGLALMDLVKGAAD
jgi:uncharacterized protein YecE (DUF72 family)